MVIGYARTSTKDQNQDLQTDTLKKAGSKKSFTDKCLDVFERPVY
jgi:DNA invertase Pin-like site-specific DNA recombinase